MSNDVKYMNLEISRGDYRDATSGKDLAKKMLSQAKAAKGNGENVMHMRDQVSYALASRSINGRQAEMIYMAMGLTGDGGLKESNDMSFPSSFRKKANALALKVFDRERRKSEIPQELLDRDREGIRLRGLDDTTIEYLWRLTGAREPLWIEGYGKFGGSGKVSPADLRAFVRYGGYGLWDGYWEALAIAAQKARLYSEEIEGSARGAEMRRLLESLEEATRYNVGGDSMTKGQMMKKAIGKEVVFMSRDSKPSFHAVMDKDGTVFKISKRDYMKSKLKDMTSPQQMTKFIDFEMSRLKPSLSMSQAVDFNMAAKGKSKGEQLAILRSMVESESAGVEGIEESRGDLSRAIGTHNSRTDYNDHAGALAALAEGLGMKSEAAVANAMVVIRDYEGHSPAYLEKLRKEITTRVHNKAKSTKFGPATVYDALD